MFPFLAVVVTNAVLYLWLLLFHSVIPFSYEDYIKNANHFKDDLRVTTNTFYLPNAIAQYDSQWYLKIAETGYPSHPALPTQENTRIMDGLLYNFFPLYPFLIAVVNVFISDVEMSAFLLSNLLLVAISYSFYFVVLKWYSHDIAAKALLLLLIFPFSIFLRGYFAEGVRILLFIWFCYGLTEKKFLLSAVTLGLMSIASGISVFLVPFYWIVLAYYYVKKKLQLAKLISFLCISVLPLLSWVLFCSLQAGDPFYFVKTRALWYRPDMLPIIHNALLLITFPSLPLRSFYGSQIDALTVLLMLCLVFLSRNVLPRIVWGATIVLLVTPLLLQDTISTTRFSIVLFPFFIYLATLKNKYVYFLFGLFFVGLLFISLFYINWYWVE